MLPIARHSFRLFALAVLATLLAAAPAAAQSVTFPRLGVSAAPDRYVPEIEVQGDETFDLYIVVLGDTDGEPLGHDYRSFHWGVLAACCGGAATIVAEEFNPACDHDGTPLGGVVTTADECLTGDSILLCTLTLQMTVNERGTYYVLAGPFSLAQTCDLQDVVMTDTQVTVRFTPDDSTSDETQSWSSVKNLFRN